MGRVRKKETRDKISIVGWKKKVLRFFFRVSWEFIDRFGNFPWVVCVCAVECVTWKFHFLLSSHEIELKTDIFTNFYQSLRKFVGKKFLIQLSLHLISSSRLIIVIMARWMFKKRFDFLRFLRFLSPLREFFF